MSIAQPIRAEIEGDTCGALGVAARSSSPVLSLCRKLVADGYDPTLPLEVYRGDVLCLRIRSIGETAGLEINSLGTGFRPQSKAGRGSPVEFQHEKATQEAPVRSLASPALAIPASQEEKAAATSQIAAALGFHGHYEDERTDTAKRRRYARAY